MYTNNNFAFNAVAKRKAEKRTKKEEEGCVPRGCEFLP